MKHTALVLIILALITGCTPADQPSSSDVANTIGDGLSLEDAPLDGRVDLVEVGGDAREGVSFEDFAAMLEKEAIFAEYDRNRDGVLDESEFARFVASGLDPFATFYGYDTDASGAVTPDELSHGLFNALFGAPSHAADEPAIDPDRSEHVDEAAGE